MSVLKKMFGAGDAQDDEILYKSDNPAPPSTATENTDRAIQSERDIKPGAAGQAETGLSSSNVQSQTAGTTAATTEASGLTFASGNSPQATTDTAAAATSGTQGSKEASGLTFASGHGTEATAGAGAAGAAGVAGAEASGLTFAKEDEKPPVVGGSMADASAYKSSGEGVSGSVPGESGLTFADNKPPVVGGSMADSSAYMGSDTKEDDNRGISAGRALKPEEGQTKFDTDDISKATYTERSFPLASGDTTTSHSTGEAAAAGGVFGATIVGAGAYAAASRNDDKPATTTGTDELHPEQADSAGRIAPGHVPGEFPNEGVDPHPGRGVAAGAAVGAAAAGGAGGAAHSTYDQTSGGLAGQERERFFGRPMSSPPVSPPQSPDATQTEFKRDDSHLGRDAAAAGGLTFAAGAAGAAGADAYEVHRPHHTKIADAIDPTMDDQREQEGASDPRIHQVVPEKVQETETHYGRDAAAVGAVTALGAGAGYAATRPADEHSSGQHHHGHHHHHHEKTGEDDGKKQGFFSKVFHGHDKSQEAPIGDANPSNEVQRVGEGSSLGGPAGAPTHDENLIHLVRSDAEHHEPGLVIREKPGGGIETVPQ